MFGFTIPSCCCADRDAQCYRGMQEDGTTVDGAVVIRLEDLSHGEKSPALVNQAPTIGSPIGDSKDNCSPNAVRSLSPKEREAEKVRLQNLVNNFVRNAAQGLSCVYLKEVTGERAATRYFLDKRLEHLVIVAANDATVAEVRCPIAAIQDIYCLVEDGAGCFPAKVLGPLTPEEQQKLLMVVYRSDRKQSGDTHRFCLLADSTSDRDTFLECLRILCIYSQTLATNKPGAAPAPPPPTPPPQIPSGKVLEPPEPPAQEADDRESTHGDNFAV